MKKVHLVNDTSYYHSGCRAVMQYIREQLKDVDAVESSFEDCDAVLINGEGTLHDSNVRAKNKISHPESIFNNIEGYINAGKKVSIINSTFFNNSMPLSRVALLKKCTIFVRDIYSYYELKKFGIDSTLSLDLSYFVDVPYLKSPDRDVVFGNYFYRENNKNLDIDIFNDSWTSIVNKLRHSKVLVSGRFHEIYAACVAKCPFVALKGNTWKIEGIFGSANIDLPILPQNASDDLIARHVEFAKSNPNYSKLFKWMDKQPAFKLDYL